MSENRPEIFCRASHKEGCIEVFIKDASIRTDKKHGTIAGIQFPIEEARKFAAHLGYWSTLVEDEEIETPENPYLD